MLPGLDDRSSYHKGGLVLCLQGLLLVPQKLGNVLAGWRGLALWQRPPLLSLLLLLLCCTVQQLLLLSNALQHSRLLPLQPLLLP
jgi:hypothetical protein